MSVTGETNATASPSIPEIASESKHAEEPVVKPAHRYKPNSMSKKVEETLAAAKTAEDEARAALDRAKANVVADERKESEAVETEQVALRKFESAEAKEEKVSEEIAEGMNV